MPSSWFNSNNNIVPPKELDDPVLAAKKEKEEKEELAKIGYTIVNDNKKILLSVRMNTID